MRNVRLGTVTAVDFPNWGTCRGSSVGYQSGNFDGDRSGSGPRRRRPHRHTPRAARGAGGTSALPASAYPCVPGGLAADGGRPVADGESAARRQLDRQKG
jgi:hypothetical protein